MKEWVIPFLIKEYKDKFRNLGDHWKDGAIDQRLWQEKQDYESLETVYKDLATKFLNVSFNKYSPSSEKLIKIFGETLSKLPKEVFIALRNIKNVFFAFSPFVLVQRELEDSGFKLSYNLSIKGCASRADFNGFFKA